MAAIRKQCAHGRVLGGADRSRRGFVVALGAIAASSLVFRDSLASAEEPAPEFRVIAHPDNPNRVVPRRFLEEAFLKDVSRWSDGEAIHPLDLRAESSTRARFSERVVKRSVAAVKSYWQQRIFSGRGLPPPELDTDEDVVRRVQRDRGAVGYVSGRADIGKVRLLTITYD